MDDLLDRTMGERVRIVTDLCPMRCRVEVDRTQLQSAILNIASNARDAMRSTAGDGGGTLTIRTRDLGEVEGRPYLVTELVRGRSLAELPKPVPFEQALSIGLGIARGLAAAHKKGVLHRDVKPANVMLADDGEVKLLDFGLAKIAGAPAE